MVDAYLRATGDNSFITDNIQVLEKEYIFWMVNRTVDVTYNGQTYTLNRYNAPITLAR